MSLITSRVRPRSPCRSAGYALLEALIAVLVTSVGFIGAARLQTLGMSFSNTAGLRQKATLLVGQMTDRMRANHVGMKSNAYDQPTVGSTACLSTGCTPAQLAQADMAEWKADIEAQLPGGVGIVCIDSMPDDPPNNITAAGCDGVGRLFAVKVQWNDKTTRLGTQMFTTLARPTP